MKALLVLLLATATALADPPQPWAEGVPEPEQRAALAIYKDANVDFEESRYAQALEKYREAIKHWDHPAIRFNMAVTKVNLEQPLAAYEDIVAALRYGAAPLGDATYAQALTYKKLLEGQLARVRVTCDAPPPPEVTIDGNPVACNAEPRWLLPGSHQIVAVSPGYSTDTRNVVLVAGKERVHVVRLEAVKARLERRWSSRAPWIVAGAGTAAAAIGGVLEWRSYAAYKRFDDYLRRNCAAGCAPSQISTSDRTQGRIENIAGVTLLGVGGAVMIAGLVGVYVNQPHVIAEPVPGGVHATVTWRW